jgi:uncharacterized protein YecE (DUF72 family)
MNIRIGTCSWKYESWKGILYPERGSFDFLIEYSKSLNTVEIDQWFWSLFEPNKVLLPKEKDVKLYTESVPDDFKFTIKIPNSLTLTHFYNKDKLSPLKLNPYFLDLDLFNEFIRIISPMSAKVGVLMFQFEYLNKQKINGLTEFIEKFEKFSNSIPRNYNYGIEIRNPNFLKKIFFEFLNRNSLSMVFLQGYYMPNVWDVFGQFKEDLISPVVIRLHGPDRSGIEKKSNGVWNKIIENRDEEISKILLIIDQLQEKKIDLYINVNNHYEGSAPLTINKIISNLH